MNYVVCSNVDHQKQYCRKDLTKSIFIILKIKFSEFCNFALICFKVFVAIPILGDGAYQLKIISAPIIKRHPRVKQSGSQD